MIEKQLILTNLLKERISGIKTGIIIKGIDGIVPEKIVHELSRGEQKLYASIVGYEKMDIQENDKDSLSNSIESAVKWRSSPECAGKILVFIRSETEKMHSLAEFELITINDLSCYLIKQEINKDTNTPSTRFWQALAESSDYYSFENISTFVDAVNNCNNQEEAIPDNMWLLNLLRDSNILNTKNSSKDRLQKNRDLILRIGQLSDESRKKLNQSIARSKDSEREGMLAAYEDLQNYYKYGNKKYLKNLDMDIVQELLSASEKKKNKKNLNTNNDTPSDTPGGPIRPKDLNNIVSRKIVYGNDEEQTELKELVEDLDKYYSAEEGEDDSVNQSQEVVFLNRSVGLNSEVSDMRRLVSRFCTEDVWGGLITTDENVLKDALSGNIESEFPFKPDSGGSKIDFPSSINGKQPLFSFVKQFDKQFDEKKIEMAERFTPLIDNLKISRAKLLSKLDLIMYHPVLLFGADEESKNDLINYIEDWDKLYKAYCKDEPVMREISPRGTSYFAQVLLLMDVLYVKTPSEWKAILMPMHPLYLWKYYEIFKMSSSERATLEENDKKALSDVLTHLPQPLSFVSANKIITGEEENKILPCSGSIESLPTFENRTNRYLGSDGTEIIGEVLNRWIGFAPYTRNEIRICTVDAPNLIEVLREIEKFLKKNSCRRVVYDVYLTRKQNGNIDLSKIDYSGNDSNLEDYIKNGNISISINNLSSVKEVSEKLGKRPVHIAFYFDQSTYEIEYGPDLNNLYITPLVISYEFDYDVMEQKGSLFPSSNMDSGLIGDYHKVLKFADVISNSTIPRTVYNDNADMTAVVNTISDHQTQWLVVADRDTNNYQPQNAIPIGEKQYDKRMVSIWASTDSRIISQYVTLLQRYNLYPKSDKLVELLRQYGHIASNGLISIPKTGADKQAIDIRQKGLLGTLFAAVWYSRRFSNSLVASLDDDRARLWLHDHDRKYGNERADLVGLHYDKGKNTLYINPIEVKTRDDSFDAQINKDEDDPKYRVITGHAADQIGSVVGMLKVIFKQAPSSDETPIMFTAARREVLKYQIVSECFRNIHNAEWQKAWSDVLKMLFNQTESFNIEITGILLHIKLNEVSGGEHRVCKNPEFDDCTVDYWKLTAKEIQRDIFGESAKVNIPRKPDSRSGSNGNHEALSSGNIASNPDVEHGSETHKTVAQVEMHAGGRTGQVSEKQESVKHSSKKYLGSEEKIDEISKEEINELVEDFKCACGDYNVKLNECNSKDAIIGPSVIRLKFRLARGQTKQGLVGHLEDIGREMKHSGVIIHEIPNSDEMYLDVPRYRGDPVLFSDIVDKISHVTSPEQLYFPIGRTPNGEDLIEDLGKMPHMLIAGSTGSGKTVFLLAMLASLLLSHPHKEDMQLVLSSSKLEDFIYFDGLPHLYSEGIISDAKEATEIISKVIDEESERRGKLLAEARVANITEYNKKTDIKLEPIVVVIDEFADLADQLDTKKQKDEFYKPVQRIAETGRSRGIHLVICTQRPEAKLIPKRIKDELNGRVALRVNDSIASRMIIEAPDAQYLQKHGDLIYKNGDTVERAQGYLIEIKELDQIIKKIKTS